MRKDQALMFAELEEDYGEKLREETLTETEFGNNVLQTRQSSTVEVSELSTHSPCIKYLRSTYWVTNTSIEVAGKSIQLQTSTVELEAQTKLVVEKLLYPCLNGQHSFRECLKPRKSPKKTTQELTIPRSTNQQSFFLQERSGKTDKTMETTANIVTVATSKTKESIGMPFVTDLQKNIADHRSQFAIILQNCASLCLL